MSVDEKRESVDCEAEEVSGEESKGVFLDSPKSGVYIPAVWPLFS